jgi:nucleotide-binding universal stress UspA family protein
MKVLVAVDGSDFTRRVLGFLIDHPEMLGARPDVTLISSVVSIPNHAARFVDRQVIDEYYGEEAEKSLAPARAVLAGAGITAQSLPCHGQPAARIAEQAESGGFELIVMGSRGHSALVNVALGSVVTGVLARSRVPVLVVH